MTSTLSEIKLTYDKRVLSEPLLTHLAISRVLFPYFEAQRDCNLIEHAFALFLDRANQSIGVSHLSKGGTDRAIIDIKVVISTALLCGASSIILAHNHPSGSEVISEFDRQVTSKVKKAAEFFDLKLLNHLIFLGETSEYTLIDFF